MNTPLKLKAHMVKTITKNRLLLLLMLPLLILSSASFAQVVNSESFDGTTFVPTGWTYQYVSGSTSQSWTRVISGSYPSQSPHSGAGEARFNSFDYNGGVVAIITPAFDLSGRGSSTPTVSFWMYRDAGYNTKYDSLSVLINTSPTQAGATWLGMINRYSGFAPSAGADGWYQYSFNMPAGFSSSTNYLVFRAKSLYGNDIYLDDISWTSYPPPCSGTPAPGNTIASSNPICASAGGATMSLQNATPGAGVTYQWQSSTNGTTYTNITTGGTSATYNAAPTASTYYRCQVTCSGNTGTSTPVLLAINSFLNCYCQPQIGGTSSNGCNDDDQLINVSIGTLNNNSTCSGNTYAYIDYGGSVSAPSLNLGSSYTISATNPGVWTDNIVAWIDFNHSGTFDASEFISIGTANSSVSTVSTSWAMPVNAMSGATKMRVKLRYSTTQTSGSACDVYSYGECEDYDVVLVCPSVTISTQPTASTLCLGANATFTAAATVGSGFTAAYQWQESTNGGSTWANVTNGGVYSGATTGTLTLTAPPASMSTYQYRCAVTNDCGNAINTNAVVLTVNTPPVITTAPVNSTLCQGGNTTFTCAATGTGLTYQWQISTNGGSTFGTLGNGGVYTGATTNTLALTGVTAGMDLYQYRCVISGTCPSPVTTGAGRLNVNTPPAITASTGNQTGCVGGNMTFSVTATGTALTYQWQEFISSWNNISNGGIYSGTLTGSLTMTGLTAGMSNNKYRCIISGTCTPSVTSTDAILTIGANPVITSHPSSVLFCSGSSGALSVTATGYNITYQWQVSINGGSTWGAVSNGGVYSGATTASLSVTNPPTTMSGYMYRCVVTNGCTLTATSNGATMTVANSPTISLQPASKVICEGPGTTFTVNASSSAPINYQWEISMNGGSTWSNVTNNSTFSGATTNTLTLASTSAYSMNGWQFRCALNTGCIPATYTSVAILTVNAQPVIVNQPVNATICHGQSTFFSITASGASITYLWEVSTNGGSTWSTVSNGGIYSGATTASLALTNATTTYNGYRYRCTATGSCPTAKTSNSVLLTVNPPTVMVSQNVSNTTLCSGGSTSFSVNATGLNLTYQWYGYNGTTYVALTNGGFYSGVTTNTLNITNITPAAYTYSYFCGISGACGGLTSNYAYVTVNKLPAITTNPTSTTVCENSTNVSFSCPASGTNITYQWQYNPGSGFVNLSNNSTYSGVNTSFLTISSVPLSMSTYQYRCVVSGTCTPPATSSAATLTVSPLVVPTISIAPSNGDICAGTSVTFTPTTTFAGAATYQWKLNNANVATGSTYTSSSFANGDFVSCVMTSNVACPSPKVVYSNTVTMKVTQYVTPTISIGFYSEAGPGIACSGKSVTFKATTTNAGNTPTYQWKLNGMPVGINADTFVSSIIQTGDYVSCDMISSLKCFTPASVSSNQITMTVIQTKFSGITITPNPDSVLCQGEEVTMYATYTNSGGTSKYQWRVNGNNVPGATNPAVKIGNLKNGDKITCFFTSSTVCVFPELSPAVTMTINPLLDPSVSISSSFIGANTYTFTATPVNGGSSPAYQWFRNYMAVPGETNSTYTVNDLGESEIVYVEMKSNVECINPSLILVRSEMTTGVSQLNSGILKDLGLHPNPNTGQFIISGELNQSLTNKTAKVTILNSLGQVVYNSNYPVNGGKISLPVSLNESIANGVYMVHITIDDNVTNMRFILNR